MRNFECFEKAYFKGFLLDNLSENLSLLKDKFKQGKLELQKEDENFFFYERANLTFFVNKIQEFPLKSSYIKLFSKRKEAQKYKEFLELNNFRPHQSFLQMSLKNEHLPCENFDFIKRAKRQDCWQICKFFAKFFDENYLFLFDENALLDKEIFIYKEQDKLGGALLCSAFLNTAFLDFIAVERNLKRKNVAFALLNHFFKAREKASFFRLFVYKNNQKAINFYQRAGFHFDEKSLEFYKNFK